MHFKGFSMKSIYFWACLKKLMFYYHFLSVIVQFMPVFVHFVHFLNWKMKWYYGFEFGKPIYSNEKENIMVTVEKWIFTLFDWSQGGERAKSGKLWNWREKYCWPILALFMQQHTVLHWKIFWNADDRGVFRQKSHVCKGCPPSAARNLLELKSKSLHLITCRT